MAETPEQQRKRLYEKRVANTDDELVKCLECELSFKRVGSHAVQVHGYESTAEYRRAHGLMASETTIKSHREDMSTKAYKNMDKIKDNLMKGSTKRFKDGGEHGNRLKEFWNNRKKHGIFSHRKGK